MTLHERLVAMLEAAQAALPAGYSLGYAVPHFDGMDAAARVREDAEIKRWHREELRRAVQHGRVGARLAERDVPTDAATAADAAVLVEVRHESGCRVIGAVPIDTLAGIINGPGAVKAKQAAVEAQIAGLVAECQRRVGAA